MKKFIVIMLIALLAIGSVFATDLNKVNLSVGYGTTGSLAPVDNKTGLVGVENLVVSVSGDILWTTSQEAKNFFLGLYVGANMGIPVSCYTGLAGDGNFNITKSDGIKDCGLEALVGFNALLKLDKVFSLQGVLAPTYQLHTLSGKGVSNFGGTGILKFNFAISEGFDFSVGVQGAYYPYSLSTSQTFRDGKISSYSTSVFLGGSYKF